MRAAPTIAAILALAALVGGVALAARLYGTEAIEAVRLLAFSEPSVWVRSAIAWLGVLVGLGGVAATYAAVDEASADDRMHRRTPIPFAIGIILLGVIIFWFAFALRGKAPPVEPAPVPTSASAAPAKPSTPVSVATAPAPAPQPTPPKIEIVPLSHIWEFKSPSVDGGAIRSTPTTDAALRAFFAPDDPTGRLAALLCQGGWTAFVGAASQEGPRDRNEARARARADMAVDHASRWAASRDANCSPATLLGASVGQHGVDPAVSGVDGSETGYQRRLFVISQPGVGAAPAATEPGAARRALLTALRDPQFSGYASAPEILATE